MKYWYLWLPLAGIGIWMMAAGRQPTGEEDLYSIMDYVEYDQVLARVQELTQEPLISFEAGLPLLPSDKEKIEQGVALTRKLIAYQPTQYGPYFVMAKELRALGHIDEAIRNGEQALLLIPTDSDTQDDLAVRAELAHTVATLYYDKESYERAEQLADIAVQIYRTNPDYVATAGAIKAQLGKPKDAREYANLALALDPKNPTALALDASLKEAGY